MEFRQLEVFKAVAEFKSFSKAADYLFLSQSTVSSHIKNLEKELQQKLIVRTTKSLQLTEKGYRNQSLKQSHKFCYTPGSVHDSVRLPVAVSFKLFSQTVLIHLF